MDHIILRQAELQKKIQIYKEHSFYLYAGIIFLTVTQPVYVK